MIKVKKKKLIKVIRERQPTKVEACEIHNCGLCGKPPVWKSTKSTTRLGCENCNMWTREESSKQFSKAVRALSEYWNKWASFYDN